MTEKIMLTIPETSKKTGLAKWLLRKWCKENRINFIRNGNRYLINYEALHEQLSKGEIKEV